MSYSETCPSLGDPTSPGYNQCLTHPCQALVFLALFLSPPSPSLFLDSPLSLTLTILYSVSTGPPWAIIGGVTGGVAVLAIVIGVLTWWVHKQRRCRKDTKSKDQTLLASHRSQESRQQSCLCWPTYKRVTSNMCRAQEQISILCFTSVLLLL